MVADQYLVAALQASAQGDDDRGLALLEQAASQANPTPEVLFALGSDYVERGDEAKGLACFERALALAERTGQDLPIARFQLGFLHALSGREAQADAVWAGFESVRSTHPQAGYLGQLAQGLRHWLRGELQPAMLGLRQGMAANTDNPPLNANMAKLLQRLEAQHAAAAAVAVPQAPAGPEPAAQTGQAEADAAPTEPANNVFLNAYLNGKPH